jgi:Heparan-alpha-glucosaminide N-acetyltransferase, catalytic
MALVMVQGHAFDALLRISIRADPLYQFEAMFHGSTAPGFLFASGFVAGLPRAPLSLRASVRRARRLLFVLGTGYAIHLPYWSFWKTFQQATAAERTALYACDALQIIAVTQLFLLSLQWMVGRHWVKTAALAAVLVLAAGPGVWASGIASRIPGPLGAYLDVSAKSQFPIFPFSAFVLCGAAAGAAVGRQEPSVRRRRALVGGLALFLFGLALAPITSSYVEFWGVSPAYAFVRLGCLLLLLRLVETAVARDLPGMRALALLGHETLLVFVLHLYLLYGSVVAPSPLPAWGGRLDLAQGSAVLALLVPLLLAAAWLWHAVKVRFPHEASLLLTFLGTAFVWEFLTRPW